MPPNKDHRYRELIDRLLDWNRVEERLKRYPNINHCFDIDFLRSKSKSPPYYSHFLAWRLGVWDSEDRFILLDELLGHARTLIGWDIHERCRKPGPHYSNYFALLWELQVAKFLSEHSGSTVKWMKSGPDFQVSGGSKSYYVECYTYQKSFAIQAFVEDVLMHFHRNVRVKHGLARPFSLPNKPAELSELFELIFGLFLDEERIRELERQASTISPVEIPVPQTARNFYVYFEGDGEVDLNSNIPYEVGDLDSYINVVLSEIVRNKNDANDLKSFRPNILIVNLALSDDFQIAPMLGRQLPKPDLSNSLDGLIIGGCGVNTCLSAESIYAQWFGHEGLATSWRDPILK